MQKQLRVLRRAIVASSVACVLGAALLVSVSAGSDSATASNAAAKRSAALTIASNTAPLSLDPAKNGALVDQMYYSALAYESLIRLQPNGRLAPGLATSWKYLGKKQRTFELTLRRNAKFSDGSLVTAKQVVASLKYMKTAKGPVAPAAALAYKSAKAAGPRTVRLDLGRSNPTIALTLTQRFLFGQIVGSKGTDNPKALGTTTQGAGQYKLDPAQTVSGDHYTYVPNSYYYDQKAIHFNKVTIRVIKNPQTALSALRSGQIDFATGSFQLASTAQSAGLKITSAPSAWYGVFLFDRGGAIAKPLSSQLVRQALNYATNRPGITKALYGKYGKPTSQVIVAGYTNQGYVPEYDNRYPYDPKKAKQLLAKAGYSEGFSFTIGAAQDYGNGVDIAEAVANDWAKVGVKVNIERYRDIPSLLTPWQGRKLPAITGVWNGSPMYTTAQLLLTKDVLYNPWKNEDARLSALMNRAYATTVPTKQGPAWAAVTKRVADLGWEVPIASVATVYFSAKDVNGVAVSPVAFAQDPTLLYK